MSLATNAGIALSEVYAEFFAEVGIEAIRLARRDGLETVDRTHVEKGSRRIGAGTGTGRAGSALMAIGGILGGWGASSISAVTFGTGTHSTGEWVTAIILSTLGTILFTVGITLFLTGKSD